MNKVATSIVVATAAIASAQGGTDVWFQPLTASAPVVAPNALEELTAPWATPSGILQWNLVNMREVEDKVLSPLESIVRVPAGTSSSMIDMIAYDDTGAYLFLPHETPFGAGVSRHHILTRTTEVLFQGDQQGFFGNWQNDFGAFDPCRFTPNGTLFLGEEWAGEGRLVEVLNPFAPKSQIQIRELNSIANVAHEGINFSLQDKRTIYYIDEWNSGSIYKFVMSIPGDYTKGQTFVLSVDAFKGDPKADWNVAMNATQPRTGLATWIPITDRNGVPLPGVTDAFRNGQSVAPNLPNVLGGRPAADDVGGTPYGRPEDMEVSKLRNGNEVFYVAVTSENAIYSFEVLNDRKVFVRLSANRSTPKNAGFAPTTGTLDSPDNLAQDALGNIYVIEDAPNGSNIGGDIWFMRDVNNDSLAESMDHFMSIRVDGSEGTGMIFNPKVPTEFVVAVQHPDSTDLAAVPNGLGDAVWAFDISNISNRDFVVRLNNAGKASSGGDDERD
ncbi:MAG TPA: alkaline phosphatase PhoX [Verrucomicrobiae bacterium]